MQPYQLAHLYAQLRLALQQDRLDEASGWLGRALGLRLGALPDPDHAPPGGEPLLEARLTYRGFKPAELAMLSGGLKPVVKFEDLPLASARAFRARHGHRYRLLAGQPYVKDYLLLRSNPVGRQSQAERLVTVYASRDDSGARLRAIEDRDREDFHACGRLLGFPECCIDAFARDFALSRADQDTLNDDACRRVLSSAAIGHPALDPLADLELLGFYPCHLDCPHAIAIARRNLSTLLAIRPDLAGPIRATLGRPVLFWRLPFFLRFDGEMAGTDLTYRAVVANAFADPGLEPDPTGVRASQTLFAAHVVAPLRRGNRLRLTAETIEVFRDRSKVTEISFDLPLAPLLVRFWPWENTFFDPAQGPRQPKTVEVEPGHGVDSEGWSPLK